MKKTIRRIRNQWTYDPLIDSSPETPEGKSLTVPDMSMSLKTLVERYTRSGQLGDVALLEPVFLGDSEEVPPIERMTPQERLDYAREIKSYIADVRNQLSDKNKMASKIEKDAKKAITEIEVDSSGDAGAGEGD